MHVQVKCFTQPINKVTISTMCSKVQQRPLILQPIKIIVQLNLRNIVYSDNP